jgi:hypothetical protein
MPTTQLRSAFIVRVWCEPDGAASPAGGEWRLSIVEAGSERCTYFENPSAIGEYLRDWIERHRGARPSH